MRCSLKLRKMSVKKYVDKMRVVKNGQLLSTFRMEHVKFEVGGQKREKICPRSYWMTPKKLHQAGKSRYNIAICNECRANKTVWGKREQEAFNNYVDQISPNFDHLPSWNVQLRTFYILPTVCSHDQAWIFLLTTNLPLLVHIVIEWPLGKPHLQNLCTFVLFVCDQCNFIIHHL